MVELGGFDCRLLLKPASNDNDLIADSPESRYASSSNGTQHTRGDGMTEPELSCRLKLLYALIDLW